MTVPRSTVLSVFSGVGGLDLGLETAGFDVVACVECDDIAQRSLKGNRGDQWPLSAPGDVMVLGRHLSPESLSIKAGELALLAGAPPCQPYSKAAMWSSTSWNGLADHRAQPLFAFLDLVDRFLPRAVLIENVPEFLRGQKSVKKDLQGSLSEINRRHGTSYDLDIRFLDAADYGVPQRRVRSIAVALRDGGSFLWPEASHKDDQVPAWDAIGDLTQLGPLPEPVGQWTGLLPSIPEGRNYLWHTSRGGGLPLFGYRTRYWSFLLKLAKNRPSWTIPAQPGPSVGPFHWENRPLTIAEMLRLQTFPAEWIVSGSRREQMRQIGNATPPLLAEVLGRSIRSSLDAVEWPLGPELGLGPSSPVPPPEEVEAVSAEYVKLIGDHPPHPGSGRGPSPRLVSAVQQSLYEVNRRPLATSRTVHPGSRGRPTERRDHPA